jgi:hypothetical protein
MAVAVEARVALAHWAVELAPGGAVLADLGLRADAGTRIAATSASVIPSIAVAVACNCTIVDELGDV